MIDVLVTVCWVLFLGCAPLLLVIRFIWPRHMEWRVVLVFIASSGWALLVLAEYLAELSNLQQLRFVDGKATHNLELGWLWALLYSAPWLIVYGIANVIRKRTAEAKHA
jgi:hypothetical protein